MTAATQSLLRQALQLSESERVEIAGALFESLGPTPEPEVDEAWRAEIRRRLAAIDSGQAEWIPWEEVRAEFRSRLRGEA